MIRHPVIPAKKRATVRKIVRCQRRAVSARILRRVLPRYKAKHARRFFWERRWAGIEPWLQAKLGRIASCESGQNPGAVDPSGTYRGMLQFDYGTWASVGGHGDPAVASRYEQLVRGAILYGQRGAQPWPVCGSR